MGVERNCVTTRQGRRGRGERGGYTNMESGLLLIRLRVAFYQGFFSKVKKKKNIHRNRLLNRFIAADKECPLMGIPVGNLLNVGFPKQKKMSLPFAVRLQILKQDYSESVDSKMIRPDQKCTQQHQYSSQMFY